MANLGREISAALQPAAKRIADKLDAEHAAQVAREAKDSERWQAPHVPSPLARAIAAARDRVRALERETFTTSASAVAAIAAALAEISAGRPELADLAAALAD